MKGEFIFIVNGHEVTYDNFNNVPEKFDHLVKFAPELPLPPHKHGEHEEIALWTERLHKLIEKERARSN